MAIKQQQAFDALNGKEGISLEILAEEFGETLLGLLAGSAVIALFAALLNYVTSF